MSVLSTAADDLTGPKALKTPLGLRSGTPECPAERAGEKIRFPIWRTSSAIQLLAQSGYHWNQEPSSIPSTQMAVDK